MIAAVLDLHEGPRQALAKSVHQMRRHLADRHDVGDCDFFTWRDAEARPGIERGAGLTRACGSAACATAVAAVRLRRTDRTVQISLPGGELSIEWRAGDDHVLMTGPATFEYEGRFDPGLFAAAAAAS